ncbi:MAG: HAD-IA family hydrolase [Candidatus Aenigmarchaeota archaeon]|nr:HAD-IA family hydrolase [Candidatus Aenigmarchaeota archaeon]
MKKLVLFDIDKTLIKDLEWEKLKFSEVFKKVYGIDASLDKIEHSGMTDQEKIFKVLKRRGLKEKEILSKMEHCEKIMLNGYSDKSLEKFDGVKELLEGLEKNNILIGTVTGNFKSVAILKLKKVGLYHYFKVGGFGNDRINRAKIINMAIKRAKEKFDFKFNNNVFLIGDTLRDIKAAKEAGIKVIGVATGVWTEEQLKKAGADFVFKDFKDRNKILKVIL